jgi:hypothetical protein
VFDHAGYVLLEVPALALVLAAAFHFERYLGDARPRDAVLAGLFAALCALTRFNGVLLLPYFLLRLACTRNLGLLARRPVLVGVALALVLTLPYYLLTWREYAPGLTTGATEGTTDEATGFLDVRNFYLYPAFVPELVGWPLTVAAAAGLVLSVRSDRRAAGPYLALLAATYLLCVPFAGAMSRYAIYAVPALAVFAAVALRAAWRRLGRIPGGLLAAGVLGYAAWAGVTFGGWYLRGNEPAAVYVVANASGDRPVLIDSEFNGGFVYYVRRADPARRVGVLRGDKLLYAVLSDPGVRYEEFAKTDAEVLAALHKYDPELIVVEEPRLVFALPAAARLRAVLRANPDRFRLEHVVPYESNHRVFGRGRLEIWRKLDRNPAPAAVEVPVLGLGKSLGSGR